MFGTNTVPQYPPEKRTVVGDTIFIRGKEYRVVEIEGKHLVVEPVKSDEPHLAEDVRRALNEGWS